jgi:hypothetical protein
MIFTIKRGDTSPAMVFTLDPPDINLVGASIRFQMQAEGGATVIDEAVDPVSLSPPKVGYEWQSGDTDVAGRYQAEYRVVYADGSIETFPNNGFITVYIPPDVPSIVP